MTTLTDDATATAANCVQGATGTGGGNANCSLRDAVGAANAVGATGTAGSPVIGFLSTLGSVSTPGVYDVSTGGVISISHSMKMSGLGQTMLTVRGGTTALTVTNAQIFNMSGGTVTISGMTLANGGGDGYNNDGSGGGAIEMTGGTLSVANSTLTGNTNAAGYGGAISEWAASLAVTGSTFTNNSLGDKGRGGAILAFDALTVSNSTFTGNSVGSQGDGGAIAAYGALTVSNSTFSNNTMGGGDGHGGAIVVSGTLAVRNTTFSGNGEASNSGGPGFGGAIEADGAATVTNSTFSGNRVNGNGGAIFGGSPLIVSDSIFTSDSAGGGGSAIDGGPGSTATNVVYNNETFNSITLANSVNGDPKLTVLGNYGGTTQTMLPTPGSAAICAGATVISGVTIPTTDQRGAAHSAQYCAAGQMDAGAVQTSYAIGFGQGPSTVNLNTVMAPVPTVLITEHGVVFSASSPTIAMSDLDGALTAGGSAASSGGVASFSGLTFGTVESSDTLTASLVLNANAMPAAGLNATSGTFSVVQSAQTILFTQTPASPALNGASGTVTATSSAGLPISYAITGPATLSGSTVTYTGDGLVRITASQAGNSQYAAAAPVSVQISVIGDYIWLVNADSTRVKLYQAGTVDDPAIGAATTTSKQSAIAFDSSGDAWSVASSTNILSFANSTGLTTGGSSGGGLNGPVGVAVDGLGNVWVANAGNSSISEFTNGGAAVTGSAGYAPDTLSAPAGIAIDSSGSVWVTNGGNDSVTRVLGVAAPVVTPIVNAVINSTPGARP